ncbi:MAG: hypothetical protein HC853_12225 [Anaerolineae bacterium]|nr:hypothetical protein [Anaerolineae bacterium]
MKRRLHASTTFGLSSWVVVALTALAAVLRLVDLNTRSFWLDDGFTLLRVFDSWQNLLNNTVYLQGIKTTDLHPPFYFALLKAWAMLEGYHLFALRLFSPACAVLLVPLTYAVARRYISTRASVIAAAFAALGAPYQWYGWEMRMYTFVAMMAALTLYVLLRAYTAQRHKGWWWLAWLVVTVLACYSHYTLVFTSLVQAAALLERLLQHRWRIGPGVLIVGAVVAAVAGAGVAAQGKFAGVALGPYLIEMFGGAIFGLNAADPLGFGCCCWLRGAAPSARPNCWQPAPTRAHG